MCVCVCVCMCVCACVCWGEGLSSYFFCIFHDLHFHQSINQFLLISGLAFCCARSGPNNRKGHSHAKHRGFSLLRCVTTFSKRIISLLSSFNILINIQKYHQGFKQFECRSGSMYMATVLISARRIESIFLRIILIVFIV